MRRGGPKTRAPRTAKTHPASPFAEGWGSFHFSTAQLKTIQEAITLVVFCVFSIFYLKEDLRWNYLVGFALMISAVFFVFKKW